jgi:hypothetical protein
MSKNERRWGVMKKLTFIKVFLEICKFTVLILSFIVLLLAVVAVNYAVENIFIKNQLLKFIAIGIICMSMGLFCVFSDTKTITLVCADLTILTIIDQISVGARSFMLPIWMIVVLGAVHMVETMKGGRNENNEK